MRLIGKMATKGDMGQVAGGSFALRGGRWPEKVFCLLKCSQKGGLLKMDDRQCFNPTVVFQVRQDRFHLIAFCIFFLS